MQQIEVSYDKSHPLNPQWEYCPMLSYQPPIPCSGPTDTRWPSVNQPVGGEMLQTSHSDRCSLSAPSSHRHTVIMVYSNTLNSYKTLKGKEDPSGWTWINHASTHCTIILAWFYKWPWCTYIQWGKSHQMWQMLAPYQIHSEIIWSQL